MAWKPERNVDPGAGEAGAWLNWNDGETKELVVLNDQPIKHIVHWVEGKGQPCTGRDCGACRIGVRASQRYTVHAWCDGEITRWEMALLTWRDLAALAEMSGQLRGLQLRVRRTGTGRQTRYNLIVTDTVPEDELPPEEAVEPWQPDEPELPAGGLISGDFTRREVVVSDPQGAAAYAKELAASLDTTAKAVLAELAGRDGEAWEGRSPTGQLHALILELERRVAALAPPDVAPVSPDLEELLA